MTFKICIFPVGTDESDKPDYFCMVAKEYSETVLDDEGEDVTATHADIPSGRNESDFEVSELNEADANTKMTNILNNKFNGAKPFKGLNWVGEVVVIS